ncbi:MAG: ATP-binding cassette domain-containing protein, partial [Lachnospiraceae bacterium]
FGLIVEKTVSDNSVIASLDDYTSGIFINEGKVKEVSQKYMKLLKIKTPSVNQFVVNLSGGNQQKVVIAKWLIRNSDILIFDEPTRGIDVGAKSEIYTLMNELVKQGKSIIMISSELPEVLRMSDRIVIMCEGKKTGELKIEDASQEKIMHYATLRE